MSHGMRSKRQDDPIEWPGGRTEIVVRFAVPRRYHEAFLQELNLWAEGECGVPMPDTLTMEVVSDSDSDSDQKSSKEGDKRSDI